MKEGFQKRLFRYLATFCAAIFQRIVILRNFFYDRKICSAKKVRPFVISVGNIIAGGSGKTPIVMKLIEELSARDIRVCVLSRGYRSKCERKGIFIAGNTDIGSDWEIIGDEPALMKRRYPHVHFGIGKNRKQNALIADHYQNQILILDDGFQYRALARDIEMVILSAVNLFGKGNYLPLGSLREPPASLARAHYVIITHIRHSSQIAMIKNRITMFTDAKLIFCKNDLYEWVADKGAPPFFAKQIALFCGIGHPETFVTLLEEKEMKIMDHLFLRDHSPIKEPRLKEFCDKAKKKGAEALICTEKDWIKLDHSLDLDLPLYYTKMQLEIIEGQEEWEKMMEKISQHVKMTTQSIQNEISHEKLDKDSHWSC